MSTTRTTALSPGVRAKLTAAGYAPWQVGRTFNGPAAPAPPADGGDLDITIPDTPAGIEELLLDNKKVANVVRKGKLNELVRAYAKVVLDKDQEIATQVKDETQRVLSEWLKENREGGVAPVNLDFSSPSGLAASAGKSDARSALYNPKAMGAQIDKEFDSSAAYFRAIWHNTNRDARLQASIQRVRNAFSSTVPSEGGFLVPETLRSELLRVSLETSIVRPRARVIPMESLRVPFPAIDTTSNVSSVYGGLVGYWTEEGAALTQSQAAFRRIVLDAKKLTMYTEVPNELVSDSAISFQAFIDEIFPEALGFYEDDAYINGGGTGEPLGFLNAAAMVTTAKESGQLADTVVWENIVKMYARMLPSSLARAVWIVSPNVFPELATMALSVGTGGSAIWLNNGAVGPPMTILGRPVIVSEKVPTLGNAADITFVDLGFYLIGDRQVMSAMSSPHYKFANDLTAYRIIQRVDGRPWLESAITPKNNGDTLSPFVQLAERA